MSRTLHKKLTDRNSFCLATIDLPLEHERNNLLKLEEQLKDKALNSLMSPREKSVLNILELSRKM